MDQEPGWYIEFEASQGEAYDRLARIVEDLRREKERGVLSADDELRWRGYFSAEELARFWWPTPEESAEHLRRWYATPVDKRGMDPALRTPWDFGSMIDCIANAEMLLIGVERITDERARLVFDPYAGPHGSWGPLTALVESFGFRITRTEGV